MANLEADRDRAQIILVTGFALAIAFVAIALVMNSVIYTENLATRSEASKASDSVTIRADLGEAADAIVGAANRYNNSTYETLQKNVTRGIENMTAATERQQLQTGKAVSLTMLESHNGTRVRQTDDSRPFTAADGRGNWTLVKNVDEIRTLWLNVTEMEKATVPNANEAVFNLTAQNTTTDDTWNVTLINETGTKDTYSMYVTDGNGDQHDCNDQSGEFFVNVTEGGVTCGGTTYEIGSGMGEVDLLRFSRGQNVLGGRYEVFVRNASESIATPSPYGSMPFYDRQLYTATLYFSYEEQRMVYGTNLTVGPGDDGA